MSIEEKLPNKPFLSIDEVAELFDVNHMTIRRLIQAGKLRSFKVGGLHRIEKQDLIDYFNSTVTK